MPAHPFYNFPGYAAQPGIAPAGKIVIKERDPEEAQQIVNEFILKNWKKTARSPRGELAHPYLVPGATYDDLWDWDAFFTGCVIPEEGLPYASGSCLDLLDAPLKDGRPSKKASVSGNYEYTQHPYPLRAQFAAVMLKRGALNENALAPRWEILERTLLWYEEKCRDKEVSSSGRLIPGSTTIHRFTAENGELPPESTLPVSCIVNTAPCRLLPENSKLKMVTLKRQKI